MTDLAMSLQRLRLAHGAAAVSKLLEGAHREEWNAEELLTRLVETELFGREQQKVERRIKAARFPMLKTLEEFDFTFQTSIKKQVLLHLAGLDFVREPSNVILVGPPGTGKTHLSTALGLKAVLDPNRGALLAARELQKRGKIGFIGITGAHSPIDGRNPPPPERVKQELEVMAEAIKTGQFDTMMLSYHIEWQGEPVQRLIALAREYDVGVIVKKPLGGGKLIAQYGAKRLLQFVIENPDIHTAIPGMARMEHVHEDVPVGYAP